MNVSIEFQDNIYPTRSWNQIRTYHLYYEKRNCNRTLIVSHGRHHNTFTITLNIGKTAGYFASYRFISHGPQDDQLELITDEYSILFLYIYFTSREIETLRSQIDLYFSSSDLILEILCVCLRMYHADNKKVGKKTIILSYIQDVEASALVSLMVEVEMSIFINPTRLEKNKPSYRILLKGWRVDCNRLDIPRELSELGLNFVIRVVIRDSIQNTSVSSYIVHGKFDLKDKYKQEFTELVLVEYLNREFLVDYNFYGMVTTGNNNQRQILQTVIDTYIEYCRAQSAAMNENQEYILPDDPARGQN
ncbi:hypothetical protein RF11_11123 [Thelohanellus kitauei]|uniref:Uncharacterized protein n=1 Tax=Thelohanellus kitauei TaxID=669202 RepID=A0A0C2MQE3_THEKT|nr:hypothetical protein RF11_11123 [Thelohanellus kitauei]